MQVENGAVWQAKEPLQELLAAAWPVKTAYALARLGRRLQEHYTLIDQVRTKLVTQYGTVDEKGRASIKPDSENWGKFVAEFNELMLEKVEIALEKVALPDVEIEVKPAVLMALEDFVGVA